MKRRPITQLPAVHQTDPLKRFFGATVDHLFQPGNAVPISGYIGHVPEYNDASKDFYKVEPNAARTKYQLEPTMVSQAEDKSLSAILFYDDLVSRLSAVGALVSNTDRLFKSEYWTWAPPVDIDKINNSQYYYWSSDSVPALKMTLPGVELPVTYQGDGSTNRFALPPSLPRRRILPADQITVEGEIFDGSPRVLVNGRSVPFTLDGQDIVLATTPLTGIPIEVYRYGSLGNGSRTNFAIPLIYDDSVSFSASDIHVFVGGRETKAFTISGNAIVLAVAPAGDIEVSVTIFSDIREALSRASHTVDISSLNAAGVKKLVDGLKIEAIDPTRWAFGFETKTFSTHKWDEQNPAVFYVDGVGQTLIFTPESEMLDIADPFYAVVSREHRAGSFFSRANRWVAREALAWCEGATTERQANRPICEFRGDLKLFNYGTQRAPVADATVGVFSRVTNFTFSTHSDDAGRPINAGDIVLIGSVGQSFDNKFVVWPTVDDLAPAFVGTPDIVHTAVIGDVFVNAKTNIEYRFAGDAWLPCAVPGDRPLFDLFDQNGISIGDEAEYPETTFNGSAIFGFEVGDGVNDVVLGFPVNYDTYGQIIFENFLYTQRYRYRDGDITGYYFYQQDGVFRNQWYKAKGVLAAPGSSTDITVPLNLQANPNFGTPTLISRNNWFKHFSSISENQIGFSGQVFADNNWSTTDRDLSVGTEIIQARSPLLKLMMLMTEQAFDPVAVIKYVESEYSRFKLKVHQKIRDRINGGLLTGASDFTAAAREILASLGANKTPDFAFFLSRIAGGTYFIPATPATMSITPMVKPTIISENGIAFIVGHDGSRTGATDAITDGVVLAIEQLIFNSRANEAYHSELRPILDEYDLISGQYRVADYSRDEVNVIMQASFEEWARVNNADYLSNLLHDPANPFTWNYGSIADRNGASLPGNWRAIYRHYFDTETPHLTPWEMVGFAERPTWWNARYGVAPYTRLNTLLWQDMEAGRIASGPRAGLDTRFARPDLLSVLPIDINGNLLDPVAARIVPNAPSIQFAQESWVFGDGGPIENLWRRSSSFGFAKALALFLMRPAQFVEDYWDTDERAIVHGDQWVDLPAGRRVASSELTVHGEFDAAGVAKVSFGIQNWIVEYLINRGQTPARLGTLIRGLDVRLAHKMAGFTTTDRLTISAESFGLVPPEDVAIELYQSPGLTSDYYSGIIIENLSPSRWRIFGYNSSDPYFDIEASDRAGRKLLLTGVPERVVNDWRPSVYYKTGMLVLHLGVVYEAKRNHTSGQIFENLYWEQDEVNTLADEKLYEYLEGNGHESRVPYASVVNNRQDVLDFLFSYARTLAKRGFVFDEGTWQEAAQQFITWSKIRWSKGSFITLSPGARSIKFSAPQGYVLNLEGPTALGGILNRTGHVIDQRKTKIDRLDDELVITADGDDIYGVSLRKSEIEHVIVFSNRTIFDDLIYDPVLNIRQTRLKMSARRTTEWNGRYDAPGFIISQGQIVNNFDKSAEDLRYMFDIELADNTVLRDHARHTIGFQKRDYLSRLLLNETQQFELYQGMIQQKGARGALNKIVRSRAVEGNRDLTFLEEWAFRIGEFGSYEPRAYLEMALNARDMRREQQVVHLGSNLGNESDNIISLINEDSRWIDRPVNFNELTVGDEVIYGLPNAGYCRTSDADHHAATMPLFAAKAFDKLQAGGSFRAGESIWLYDHNNTGWAFFYLVGEKRITLIETAESNGEVVGTRLVLGTDHGLVAGDTILINGPAGDNFAAAGVYQIADAGIDYIEIDNEENASSPYDFAQRGEEGPLVFRLTTARFPNRAAALLADRAVPLLFVDDNGQGKWSVLTRVFLEPLIVPIDLNNPLGPTKIVPQPPQVIIAREQPRMMNSARIASALIYDRNTAVTANSIKAQPVTLARITPIDPMVGCISGIADREITYKLEYDPAAYAEDGNLWTDAHVGQLWWDMSTTWFINPYTDLTPANDEARYIAELQYRANNWSRLAPGTEIDIYEWTRSDVPPSSFVGEVHPSGQYTTAQIDNAALGKVVTEYYFWVKNPIATPAVAGRTLDAQSCADIIANPSAAGLPWTALLSPFDFVISTVRDRLTDDSTVLQLQLQLTNEDEDIPHRQWVMLRPGDQTSLPSAQLWNKLRDSLVGIDDNFAAVPNPRLHQQSRTGIAAGQSMFDADKRKDARRSFITLINYQLGKRDFGGSRSFAETVFDTTTAPPSKLIWSANGYSETLAFLPPKAFYDVATSDQAEFEELVNSQSQPGRRVLFDNRYSANPSWSVWRKSNNKIDLVPMFDYTVDKITDLARLGGGAIPNNRFVLVRENAEYNGFWTVHRYLNGAFSIVAAQQLDTTGFWEFNDWYSGDYTAEDEPVITYADVAARDRAESPVSNRYVKVLDDGSGYWIWTVFIDDAWQVVARQSGTIQLSERFLEDRPLYGWANGEASFDKVVRERDGTLELREMIGAILDNLLSNAEKNELWFSMVNFVHAHHDQVDWAFKTSFLSVAGFNEKLTTAPIAAADNTPHILSYIDEVKPYRVTVRDFARSLRPDLESFTMGATDFDKPVYYDPATMGFRVLDEERVDDIAIMEKGVWSHWLHNVDLRRNMRIKLVFDRVWFEDALDAGAAHRITQFYQPTAGMKPLDLRALLDLDFKGTTLSGSTFASTISDSVVGDHTAETTNGPDGFAMLDPRVAPDTPEELVRMGAHDILLMQVDDRWGAGAPKQFVRSYDVAKERRNKVKLPIGCVARSVIVFFDGVRGVPGVDYLVDLLANELTEVLVKRGTQRTKTVVVHAFGHAGHRPIIDQVFTTATAGSNQVTIPALVLEESAFSFEVLRNGSFLSATRVGNKVAFNAQAGEQIIVTFYRGAVLAATRMVVLDLTNTSGTDFQATLPAAARSFNRPLISSMMIEVDGRRLAPPTMFWMTNQRFQFRAEWPTASAIRVVDDTGNSSSVVAMSKNNLADAEAVLATNPAARFTLWEGHLIITDADADSRTYAVVFDGTGEFTINDLNGNVSIPAYSGGAVRALYWRNDALMKPKTWAFLAEQTGVYTLSTSAFSHSSWLTINGLRLVEGVDYTIEDTTDGGWGIGAFDTFRIDSVRPIKVAIKNFVAATDRVVLTLFEGRENQPAATWQHSTTTPDIVRFRKVEARDGYSAGYEIEHGAWATDRFDTRFEGGVLASAITRDADTLTIVRNPAAVPAVMLATEAVQLPVASDNEPGVVWIGAERIEYFRREIVGETVVLSEVRRSTKGTTARDHASGAKVRVPNTSTRLPAPPLVNQLSSLQSAADTEGAP